MSTYPPTHCGLATFAASLATALRQRGTAVDVVRVIDEPAPADVYRPEVRAVLPPGSAEGRRRAADALARADAVLLQHEYGIYGGPDGAEVLDLLAALRTPAIVTLHTVLARPSSHQRVVLGDVCAAADRVVVMSHAARDRLLAGYAVDPGRVAVVPHGAADNRGGPLPLSGDRPTILTWGLIGPGKGIETALEAIARLDGDVRYVVAGETHPKVRARDGEAYREALRDRAVALGIGDRVVFDDGYRDLPALLALIGSADVVLLPYESREQVTSGVLADSLASGRPVVATAFPHACELLGGGAGLVVPHGDAVAMAAALWAVLGDPPAARWMGMTAGRLAEGMLWPAVAARYLDLVAELVAGSQRVPA